MNLNKYLIIGLVLIMGLMMTLLLYKTNENLETQEKSFHILIATIGKDGIFRILKSLKAQLNKNDYLTIVFDGPNWPNVKEVIEYTKDFKCKVSIIVEEINLGHWGHAIRNKHKNLKGDYVFHVDDDDDIDDDVDDDDLEAEDLRKSETSPQRVDVGLRRLRARDDDHQCEQNRTHAECRYE